MSCAEENCDEFVINTVHQTKIENDISLAKEKELANGREQGINENIEDMGQSFITPRWVLRTKMVNGKKTVKARLCARGFQELLDFCTDSPICSRESVRIAFAIIASNGWTLNSIDVKTAYLQGKLIERTVFIHPPKGAKTSKIWRLHKCIYGLADAPRQWYLRVREELIKLRSRPSDLDAALFCWFSDGTLVGILICFVEGMIWGSTQSFKVNVIDKLCKVSEIGSVNYRIFKYIGIDVKQDPDNSSTVNQNSFANTIQPITIPNERLTNKETKVDQEERKLLREVIGQLNWLAGITRPDISYDVCKTSTKVKDATISDVLNVNKIVKKVKNELWEIHFPCLDPRCFHIRCYSDASFNNLPNGGSQGGHIVFLCDSSNRCCPLTWTSATLKRVVRSTLAVETLSLVDSSETTIYLSKLTGACVNGSNHPMEIRCITDNLSLFETVHSIQYQTDNYVLRFLLYPRCWNAKK